VPRNEIGLLQRHVELRFVGEFEREHFLFAVRRWNAGEAREPSHAVFEVNDEIVLVQLAEIDLGTVTFGMVKPPARVRRETAEQFSRRQNDQIGRRKTKTARQGAEKKINILQHIAADQFTETLDRTLGLKINHDPRFTFTP